MLVFTWIRPVFCDVFPPRFVGTWFVLASGFLSGPCKIGFVYLNVSADLGEVFRITGGIACIFLIEIIYIYISDSDVTFVHLFISVSYLSLFRDA